MEVLYLLRHIPISIWVSDFVAYPWKYSYELLKALVPY